MSDTPRTDAAQRCAEETHCRKSYWEKRPAEFASPDWVFTGVWRYGQPEGSQK